MSVLACHTGSLRDHSIAVVESNAAAQVALRSAILRAGAEIGWSYPDVDNAVESIPGGEADMVIFGYGLSAADTVNAGRNLRSLNGDTILVAFIADCREPVLDALNAAGFDCVFPSHTLTYGLSIWPRTDSLLAVYN